MRKLYLSLVSIIILPYCSGLISGVMSKFVSLWARKVAVEKANIEYIERVEEKPCPVPPRSLAAPFSDCRYENEFQKNGCPWPVLKCNNRLLAPTDQYPDFSSAQSTDYSKEGNCLKSEDIFCPIIFNLPTAPIGCHYLWMTAAMADNQCSLPLLSCECGSNSRFSRCTSACPKTCGNYRKNTVCTEQCTADCQCMKTDHVFKSANRTEGCIPRSECPPEKRKHRQRSSSSRVEKRNNKNEPFVNKRCDGPDGWMRLIAALRCDRNEVCRLRRYGHSERHLLDRWPPQMICVCAPGFYRSMRTKQCHELTCNCAADG